MDFLRLLRFGKMDAGQDEANQQKNSFDLAMPFHLITLSAGAKKLRA
jgi:hypothetical protein